MSPELDASAIRIYAVLSKHANRARQSFPGLVKLAEEACMSKPTVIKALTQLEAAGAVEIKRERMTNLRHKVNLYHLPLNRAGSKDSELGGSQNSLLGSKKTAPPSSKDSLQELDRENQLTRSELSNSNLNPPRLPGESHREYMFRIAETWGTD